MHEMNPSAEFYLIRQATLRRWRQEGHYEDGVRRGKRTEAKFFNAFLDMPRLRANGLPEWVVSVEKANVIEDLYKHLDAVVYIRHFLPEKKRPLKIHIQIKTSERFANRFKAVRHSTRIGVLVIPVEMTEADFLPAFYQILCEERAWLAKEMKLEEYLDAPVTPESKGLS